jgi:hypothetical protein
MDAGDHTESFGLGVKQRMFQKAPNELGSAPPSHVQPDQTITCMCPFRAVEIPVQSEKGGLRQAMQQGYQILIVGTQVGKVHADCADANSPLTQQ